LPEQEAISEFMWAQVQVIERTIDTLKRGLSQLGELRSALITAAVTGRIDVREAAHANERA
jgi:type I restriction enzyme S subunit